MGKQLELPVSWAIALERLRADGKRSLAGHAAGRAISTRPPDVAAVLLDYLKGRLGVDSLAYTEKPIPFTDGFETYTYHFQLQSSAALSPRFAQPLAVRIYCGLAALPRARREFLVQRHLHQLQYPVAEPLFLEEDCTYLDGPFLVM